MMKLNNEKLPNAIEMKPFSEYTAEELAMEKLFIRWVRFPDDDSIDAFWEGWQSRNPEMKRTISEARSLVIEAANFKTDPMSQQETNTLWGRIRNSLETISDREPVPIRQLQPPTTLGWEGILIGAVIAALLLLLAYQLLG
ncbi:hypothetical protein [Dyadobacter tibetensis]|uniref:hypothetical protein n=1 Tax=Dyadobacter tibetensis TaxID=1211851 RepID=UPI00046F2236|nr:hypothetical protein [Dyadobacter tibetensis]